MHEPKTVVISLHGIRTRGEWQKALAELLSAKGAVAVGADYGYLSLAGFLIAATLQLKADWFLKKYEETCAKYRNLLADATPSRYPCLVAHSFGTFVAAHSMLKYEQIKFDQVIICGSILKTDFPWWVLLHREQVRAVRHEYGLKDIWTRFCRLVVPNTGNSGAVGFEAGQPEFDEESYDDYKHSDFFSESHMTEKWLPLLRSGGKRFHIRHGRFLKSEAEFDQIASQTTQIDEAVFGSIQGYREVEPSLAIAKEWIRTDPDIYTWLVDQEAEEYVGYVNAVFVKVDRFDDLVARGIPDNCVREEVMAVSQSGGRAGLCVLSIAVRPGVPVAGEGHSNCQAHSLMRGLCAKLMFLGRYRRLRVTEIAAVGWTAAGQRICEDILRFPRVGKDQYGHPIFRHTIDAEYLKKRHPYPPLRDVARLYEELKL